MTISAPSRVDPAVSRFAHRPGLDGLRAVAAVLVVLFHAGAPGLSNGYAGVDVFFVLSGFLITSLLLRERLAEGRVNLLAFYARRARRLFPAALVVLLLTSVAYRFVAQPLDIADNRSGFVAAALYASNWLFLARAQDYFAAGDAVSPVLHYWSLSVEEQFYLVWPLLLLGLLAWSAVRRGRYPLVLGALAAAGLAFSFWAQGQDEMLWYFGTFGRAYQLLLGALLAAVVLRWPVRRAGPRDGRWHLAGSVAALAGLAALLVVGSDLGPQGSWWVGLSSAAATATIIVGLEVAPRGPAGRVLSAPAARLLGKWSYAIYLWHWPVIVLGDEAGLLPQEWILRVPVATGVSIGLAALSWYLLEGPLGRVRLDTVRARRRAVGAGLAATASTAALVAVILQVPPSAQAVLEQRDSEVAAQTSIEAKITSNGLTADTFVVESADASAPTLLAIGDSHALLWRTGLAQEAGKRGWRFVMVQASTCPWMDVSTQLPDGARTPECQQRLLGPAERAVHKYKPDVTILMNRSTLPKVLVADGRTYAPGEPGWIPELERGANAFLDRLGPDAGHLVFMETWPETREAMAPCLSTGGDPSDCAAPAFERAGTVEQEEMLRRIADQRGGSTVSIDDIVCPGGTCPAIAGEVVTYRDGHHLSDSYATAILPQVLQRLDPVASDLLG